MKLLKTLKDLEELYGEERVDRELERVCLERGFLILRSLVVIIRSTIMGGFTVN